MPKYFSVTIDAPTYSLQRLYYKYNTDYYERVDTSNKDRSNDTSFTYIHQ